MSNRPKNEPLLQPVSSPSFHAHQRHLKLLTQGISH